MMAQRTHQDLTPSSTIGEWTTKFTVAFTSVVREPILLHMHLQKANALPCYLIISD